MTAPTPEQDPENKTRLTPKHSFPISSFFEPYNIAEDNIMWWLFEQLRVLRRIAALWLSPYFQQAERMHIAQETCAHVRKNTALLLSANCRIDCQRNHIQQFRSADIVLHAVERNALYTKPGLHTVIWQYLRHPNALLVFDANFGWITSKVNNLFQPQDNAAGHILKANQPPPPYGWPDALTHLDQPMSDAHSVS
ncbi:hypothetical protein FRC09_017942 [Ceratobasidium sp. 395]|nr:hypothetical protein FRC09_017942 [Ceratobasidium sp. 395]